MARKITAKKGDLRTFVELINSNQLARLQFLVDPVRALDEAGIQLDDDSKAELQRLVHHFLEVFPTAALLPTGLSGKSGKGSKAKDASAPDECCDDDDVTVLFI